MAQGSSWFARAAGGHGFGGSRQRHCVERRPPEPELGYIQRSGNTIDWNVDSDFADTEEDEVFRCDANPAPGLTPTISYLDYLGQKCSAPSVVNRGTEYDWLGAFWELQVSGGESFAEVLDLWVGALPHNWNATDTDTTAFPAERMSTSAVGVFGSSTEWDAIAAAQGIDG